MKRSLTIIVPGCPREKSIFSRPGIRLKNDPPDALIVPPRQQESTRLNHRYRVGGSRILAHNFPAGCKDVSPGLSQIAIHLLVGPVQVIRGALSSHRTSRKVICLGLDRADRQPYCDQSPSATSPELRLKSNPLACPYVLDPVRLKSCSIAEDTRNYSSRSNLKHCHRTAARTAERPERKHERRHRPFPCRPHPFEPCSRVAFSSRTTFTALVATLPPGRSDLHPLS